MSQQIQDSDEPVIVDARQSPTAAAVQRGVCRMLRNAGHMPVPEFTLPSGRRADILSVNDRGEFWIIEIKSSLADFRSDSKWPDYSAYCDRFFFARPVELDDGIFPADSGLIVADAYGAQILRQPASHPMAAARRKALTLKFARTAAHRLLQIHDPAGPGAY